METPESTKAGEKTYHTYESNPMPWWLALIWLLFFVFAFVYLLRSLWPS